jgi:hypothetical protein
MKSNGRNRRATASRLFFRMVNDISSNGRGGKTPGERGRREHSRPLHACSCKNSAIAHPWSRPIRTNLIDNDTFTMRTNATIAFDKQFGSQARLYLYRLVMLRSEAAAET